MFVLWQGTEGNCVTEHADQMFTVGTFLMSFLHGMDTRDLVFGVPPWVFFRVVVKKHGCDDVFFGGI